MEDYEKVYGEFFKEIIEDENGNVNMDQLKKELFDFKDIMNNASTVYMHVTGGAISKPNTKSEAVIKLTDEHYTGKLKPHPDYDLVNDDKVFVENSDGTTNYFILIYNEDAAMWMLLPQTDKHFTTPLIYPGNVNPIAEPFYKYGYDLLERVEDYELDELQ